MTQPTAASIPLAAKRPTTPPKPSPSRTPYRPLPGTTFSAALRAAATEAMQAQTANPSAARAGAPIDPMSAAALGIPGMPMPGMPPAGVDARLWESLMRGGTFPVQPLNAAGQANAAAQVAAAGARTEPAPQAITPTMLREAQQTFLRSIKGSDQTSVNEYESVTQARAWGFSTCSAASLTAVLRAAGQDVRIADVMKEMPGGMTIQLGLVSRPSLVKAAGAFGVRATDDVTSYEALKAATEDGQPVLVDIRNGKFPEGHWIVVTGVDENGIRCADSSRYDLTSMPRGEFLRSWSSRGIRLEGLGPTPPAPVAAPARPNVKPA